MTKKILIMVSVVMLIALVGCSQKTVKVVVIYGLQKNCHKQICSDTPMQDYQ